MPQCGREDRNQPGYQASIAERANAQLAGSTREGRRLKLLVCLVRRHAWGPWTGDQFGMYRTCSRCGKFHEAREQGPDGWAQAMRHIQSGGG